MDGKSEGLRRMKGGKEGKKIGKKERKKETKELKRV